MNHSIDLPPPPPPIPQADADFSEAARTAAQRSCQNCGAPSFGPHCYACGQSEKGMVRHLSELFSDLGDIVFNVDSRIFRTLFDLYLRPGFLTTEYLGGRRVRYVTPFRLFFFLSIAAFFAVQIAIPDIDAEDFSLGDRVGSAMTPEEVDNVVKAEVDVLNKSLQDAGVTPETRVSLEDAIANIRGRGRDRLAEIRKESILTGLPPSALTKPKSKFQFGDKPWDRESNPLVVEWLPPSLNERLNNTIEHMDDNLRSAEKDPGHLVAGFISVLPQTLIVVMPFFALFLKLVYLFKRRLYMEHLLVALHSHAFIFMSILVLLLLAWLGSLAAAHAWLVTTLDILLAAAWVWLFLYLLLMQKRVYQQGWFLTIFKYCFVGTCYMIFLSLALGIAAIFSLALT